MVNIDSFDALINATRSVCDPELPGVTIHDLGILRNITRDGNTVTITITPTYSGCPAVEAIMQDVYSATKSYGQFIVKVEIAISPAWNTSMVTDSGRKALAQLGIVPPPKDTNTVSFLQCPRCQSKTISCINAYSSTACKSLYRCLACHEPFELFKQLA
ncbi:MAG: phenylacetate-CoA oxygenase subunit PaaJ [Methylacidiphilales bacterium]|nr:phenylacetate-CoA oxygenase subunit PaaJ [Candidatus Methylacidiphilales bacterium]